MADALKKRSGHLGTITRTENSVKEILEKEPSTLTLLEISKIKCSLERCKEQVSKIEELKERIINELTENDTISEEIEAERSRIDDNDLSIKTTIKAFEKGGCSCRPETVTDCDWKWSTNIRFWIKAAETQSPYIYWEIWVETIFGHIQRHRW